MQHAGGSSFVFLREPCSLEKMKTLKINRVYLFPSKRAMHHFAGKRYLQSFLTFLHFLRPGQEALQSVIGEPSGLRDYVKGNCSPSENMYFLISFKSDFGLN